MATPIIIGEQLNYYKRKRNQCLFFIITPLFVVGSIYAINYFYTWINPNLLDTIVFVLILLYLVSLTVLKSNLSIYSMYLNYYLMLSDERGIQSLTDDFDFTNMMESIKNKGYEEIKTKKDYVIYWYRKLPYKSHFDIKRATVLLIYIKDEAIDLYSETLHHELNLVYSEIETRSKPITHQVTLFIKEVTELNATTIEDFQKVVNVSQSNRSLIQVNVGIERSSNNVYYLEPRKRYPNRMYCEVTNELKRIIPLKKGVFHDKT